MRGDPRREGARHVLLGLQQHHRYRSLRRIAARTTRNQQLICVVEEPQNVTAIEKTREFKGVYHVLMGALSPLQGIGPDELKIKGLLARVGRRRRRGDHPRDQPERRRRSDGALSRAAAQAARREGDAHRDGGARSAATSSTPTRSRCTKPWKAGGKYSSRADR